MPPRNRPLNTLLRQLRPMLVLCAGLALSGCALQADVMEIGLDMEEIQDLQRKLEGQLAKAEESAETVRAMRVRMDTVEEKLKEGISPELETRINVGLRTMERSQRQLTAARVQVEERLSEAETFFVDKVKDVSSKQAGVEDRVAAMEARMGDALRAQAGDAAPSEKGAVDDAYLKWLDERLTRLTDKISSVERMSEDAIRRMEAPKEAPVDPRVDVLAEEVRAMKAKLSEGGTLTPEQLSVLTDKLEPRIAKLEQQVVDQAAVTEAEQQRRLDQFAEALDLRLSQAEEKRAEQSQPMAQLALRVAQQEQILGVLDQRTAALAQNLEGTAGPTAAQLVQLSQRVDAMEQAGATDLTELKTTVASLQEKVGPGGPSGGEAAALAGLSGQMELLAASLDERLTRLEQAAGASASQQQVVTHVDARFAELEPRLQKISDRMALLEQTQMADMAEMSQRVAAGGQQAGSPQEGAVTPQVLEQLARHDQALTLLERRLAAVQTDPQVAFLSEQVEGLSRTLDERLARIEAGSGSPSNAAGDPAAVAGLSGQLSMVEASLNGRIDTLEQRLAQRPDAASSDSELSARLQRQEQLVAGMERRLAALQSDPQANFLTDRMETLSRNVDVRLAELEARTEAMEQPRPASQADTAALAGMSGQLALLEASLGDRIGRLEKRLTETAEMAQAADSGDQMADLDSRLAGVGERIQQLEQAQMAEMADLRNRLAALSKAVADTRDGAASP